MERIIFVIIIILNLSCFSQTKEVSIKNQVTFISKNLNLEDKDKTRLMELPRETKLIYDFLLKEGTSKEMIETMKLTVKTVTAPNYTSPKFTKDNYPGKEDGYPYDWWNNKEWMEKNIVLPKY